MVKPDSQIIGDGFIAWQWNILDGAAVVEAVLSIREGNSTGLDADGYIVSLKLPEPKESGDPIYVFDSDAADVLGDVLSSASEWRDEWTRYAGEYLRDLLAQPVETPEDTTEEEVPTDG